MKIILSRLELLAALLFSSEDDSRYTLTSVCVEVAQGAKPLLVSTDGRRLVVIENQAEQAEDFTDPHQMLLRADFIRPICALSKAFGGKLFPWIQFESKPGSKRVQVTFIGGKCFLEAEENALVEGAYPNWRQCVPDKSVPRTQINDLGINSELMSDFSRAAKVLHAPSPIIQMNLVGPESAIEVKIPGLQYFYALVMPCKTDKEVDYQPEFLGIVTDLPVKTKETAPVTPVVGENGSVAAGSPPEKDGTDEDEETIQQCIEVIRSEQKASVSLLQRRLRLGYTRAARIMDELERRELVGPAKGAEPRDINMDLQPATN